jgi:Tol biopolymer transport system component/tRNA A-37 threonylcarbamoyl transferase component Bud32
MSLAPGTILGPYEIVAPIGAGGMGEVYKARDTRLNRIVAIKVSQAQFSERFENEARAVAALNHPHICTLHDVGPNYLVMEFVEGVPLKGPLPIPTTVEYAGQILDALDAAHQKGITHRDLKPDNILVTKQGIKLLDFGLAKQQGVTLKEADATLTHALTSQGQILGTLQYMSPEQLQGKAADPRCDLFSFGCVLYEMLTGKRAFEGQNAASVIAAILERDPASLEDLRPLDRVVRRSLAKDPDQRFQTARDLKAALAWAMEQAPTVAASRATTKLLAGVAAALAIVAVAASWIAWHATRPVPQRLEPLVRLDVNLESDVSPGSFTGASAILAPDGTRLVYVSQSKLFTRRLDQAKATELTGTEGAYAPFFSPDGQWVAFFTPGKLKKVPVQGGAAISLCNASNGMGGSWGEDGDIIASLHAVTGLLRIPSAGGPPTPITELAQGEIAHRWPQLLPGGKAVLFTAMTSVIAVDGANIEVMALGDRRPRILQRGSIYGRYTPDGHLVYLSNGTLFAVPFDLDRLEVSGTPAPVLSEVAHNSVYGSAEFDFSSTGTLVYRSGGGGGLSTVQWLDSTGKTQPLLSRPGAYLALRLSPDGDRLALTSAGDIWVYDWKRDAMTPLTFGGAHSNSVWSPDGRYIVFQAAGGLFWTRSDGAGKPQAITQTKNLQFPWSFTADGKRLAFFEANPVSGNDLWTVSLQSDDAGLHVGKPEVFLQTSFDERHPSLSPDGRWMAYSSNESGSFQVYVQAFPSSASGAASKWQISNGGGVYPVWSHNGRELFFRTVDSQVMVATYLGTGDSFQPSKPRLWSEKRLALVGLSSSYDVAPDGERIAALMSAEGADGQKAQNHVTFLFNFFDELRRRVPLGK